MVIGRDIFNTILIVQSNIVTGFIYKKINIKFYFTASTDKLNQILKIQLQINVAITIACNLMEGMFGCLHPKSHEIWGLDQVNHLSLIKFDLYLQESKKLLEWVGPNPIRRKKKSQQIILFFLLNRACPPIIVL